MARRLRRRCECMGALTEERALTEGCPRSAAASGTSSRKSASAWSSRREIVELEPPHAMTVHLVSKVFDATSSQRLEELEGGRTRLTAVIETEYSAALPGLPRRSSLGTPRGVRAAISARLKELVEGS